MNKELGVWTYENVRLLAKTAKALGMPIVPSTVGVGLGVQRPDTSFDPDAVGGRSQIAHRTGIERLARAGAVPTTALAVNTELFRDWATPAARPAGNVIYWYFTEVPRLTAAVGVADAEKQAAAAALQGAK
jgi:hypothetical protein